MRVTDGSVVDVAGSAGRELRALRREMQMIFQDPFSSLNPRMTLLDIVGEPLLVNGVRSRREREDRVAELLRRVGLRPEYMRRYPHAFSGGERQRIGIARALALRPAPGGRRRAGLGARRLGAGADPEPAAGPAGGAPADLSLRGARPERRAAHQRPGGGDVRRAHRGAGGDGADLHGAHATRTPRRCCPRCPSRTRASGRSASSCRARWRIPRPRPPAATSTRAARTRSTCAGRRRRPGRRSPPRTSSACHRAGELQLAGVV